jgi:hypothetical protein
LIVEEDTDEAKENNAKYVLSVVRKLGGVIFCVWEDIVEVKPKMMFIFGATLWKLTETDGIKESDKE